MSVPSGGGRGAEEAKEEEEKEEEEADADEEEEEEEEVGPPPLPGELENEKSLFESLKDPDMLLLACSGDAIRNIEADCGGSCFFVCLFFFSIERWRG